MDKINYYKHNKINCEYCPLDYMCCTLKVKLLLIDRVRIFLKTGLRKDKYARKLSLHGSYYIDFIEGRCFFLKKLTDGKVFCTIYRHRPKICRQFPHIHEDVKDCRDIFKNWKRHSVDGVDTVEVELNSKQLLR